MTEAEVSMVGDKFWLTKEGDRVHFEVKQALERNYFYCEPVNGDPSDRCIFSQREIEQHQFVERIFS